MQRSGGAHQGLSRGFKICGRIPLPLACLHAMRAEDLLVRWIGRHDRCFVQAHTQQYFRHLPVRASSHGDGGAVRTLLTLHARATSAGHGQELMMLQCLNKLPRYTFTLWAVSTPQLGPACARRTSGGCSTLPSIIFVRDIVRCLGRSWTAISDAGWEGKVCSQHREGCLRRSYTVISVAGLGGGVDIPSS
jgi:hypothetical protein